MSVPSFCFISDYLLNVSGSLLSLCFILSLGVVGPIGGQVSFNSLYSNCEIVSASVFVNLLYCVPRWICLSYSVFVSQSSLPLSIVQIGSMTDWTVQSVLLPTNGCLIGQLMCFVSLVMGYTAASTGDLQRAQRFKKASIAVSAVAIIVGIIIIVVVVSVVCVQAKQTNDFYNNAVANRNFPQEPNFPDNPFFWPNPFS